MSENSQEGRRFGGRGWTGWEAIVIVRCAVCVPELRSNQVMYGDDRTLAIIPFSNSDP